MRVNNPEASLFESSEQQLLIRKLGNLLEEFNRIIDWEKFRKSLDNVFPVIDSSKGGRPRMDMVMMFKLLILQQLYNLSDS